MKKNILLAFLVILSLTIYLFSNVIQSFVITLKEADIREKYNIKEIEQIMINNRVICGGDFVYKGINYENNIKNKYFRKRFGEIYTTEEIIFIMEREEFYCLGDFIVGGDIIYPNHRKFEFREELYKNREKYKKRFNYK